MLITKPLPNKWTFLIRKKKNKPKTNWCWLKSGKWVCKKDWRRNTERTLFTNTICHYTAICRSIYYTMNYHLKHNLKVEQWVCVKHVAAVNDILLSPSHSILLSSNISIFGNYPPMFFLNSWMLSMGVSHVNNASHTYNIRHIDLIFSINLQIEARECG